MLAARGRWYSTTRLIRVWTFDHSLSVMHEPRSWCATTDDTAVLSGRGIGRHVGQADHSRTARRIRGCAAAWKRDDERRRSQLDLAQYAAALSAWMLYGPVRPLMRQCRSGWRRMS